MADPVLSSAVEQEVQAELDLPAPIESTPILVEPKTEAPTLSPPAWLSKFRKPSWFSLNTAAVSHRLRLRHRFPVAHTKGAVTLELGYDVDQNDSKNNRPFALAIFKPRGLGGSSVEVCSDWAAVNARRAVPLGKGRSATVSLSLGRFWDGRPRIGVSLGAPKIEAALGAGLLASGRKLGQENREIPLVVAELPRPRRGGGRRFLGASVAIDGGVQLVDRKQLVVSITRLDPVLRLEHVPEEALY